jgi:transposase
MPLAEELFAWFEVQLARLPGGSPAARAIRYPMSHRDGVVRCLEDGRIEPDTNTAERAVRSLI